jgi:hypothetical protein
MTNKTQPTDASVEAFLAAVEPERRREDGQALDALFRHITGWSAGDVGLLDDRVWLVRLSL